MKSLIRMTFIAVFGIALLCAVSVSRVEATLILNLDDLSTVGEEATIVGTDNYVSRSGAYGTWEVNNATGVDFKSDPNPDLNVTSVSGPETTGSLVIALTETDVYSAAPNGFIMSYGGTADGTIVFEFYLGSDNDDDWGDDLLMSTVSIDSPGPFSGSDIYIPDSMPTGPYSLTTVATITHTGSFDATSFNAEIQPVPEPGTIALLGIGLVGLVGSGIRKQRNRNKKS